MVLGVLSGGGWWQHAEQVVAPWAGAVEEQEPRFLEVVQARDVVQKSLVAGPGLAEVVSLVFWCAKGGSEDSEPSLLGRECRVSDPVCLEIIKGIFPQFCHQTCLISALVNFHPTHRTLKFMHSPRVFCQIGWAARCVWISCKNLTQHVCKVCCCPNPWAANCMLRRCSPVPCMSQLCI